MSASENLAIARRFLLDAFSGGNLDLLDDLLAPSYIDHNAPPGLPPGPAGIKLLLGGFRQAFPDVRFTIDTALADNAQVAVCYTVQGTHQGAFLGLAPTGRAVTFTGISVYRIAGDQMQEAWVCYDTFGLLQQLGGAPIPAAAAAG